jgi:hypothetical protein
MQSKVGKLFIDRPLQYFLKQWKMWKSNLRHKFLTEFVGSRPSNEFVDLLISAWNSIEDLKPPAVHATARRNSKDQPDGVVFFLSNILDILAKDAPKNQYLKEYYGEAKLISGHYSDWSFTQHFEAKLAARDVLFLLETKRAS